MRPLIMPPPEPAEDTAGGGAAAARANKHEHESIRSLQETENFLKLQRISAIEYFHNSQESVAKVRRKKYRSRALNTNSQTGAGDGADGRDPNQELEAGGA
jgi:predicted nucleotidyltransferase